MAPRFYGGRGKIVKFLIDRLGRSEIQARKDVEAFISVVTQAIRDGKDVELGRLGTLHIRQRKDRRQRQIRTLKHVGTTIVTWYKHSKDITLETKIEFLKELF